MTSYIREKRRQLVIDLERLKDPVDFVQRLLDEMGKYDRVESKIFYCSDNYFRN